MLLRVLTVLLLSMHLVSGTKHHKKRKHHVTSGDDNNGIKKPRAMIWPKKLMPSLHRMLSHRRHHHPHHNQDTFGLNGNRESDTINLENKIQGMLGGGGGGGGGGGFGEFGTPNEFMGEENLPDAAGRSTSDRYLVDKIMNSVNGETGDETNAFRDMMSELRMVKEAKEKKELLSTLGLNGLGFTNNNRAPPVAEVSTNPPQDAQFKGGRFEPPPNNNLSPGSRFDGMQQEIGQEGTQQFSPDEEGEPMTQSSFREEQPRYRDEQPRFDEQQSRYDNENPMQDIGQNMEMKPEEPMEDERQMSPFNEMPPQQNDQAPVNIRGNFVRERWPEENPPESFPQEPAREMPPPRNPGPPMEIEDEEDEMPPNIQGGGGNKWNPMQGNNMADRRMIYGAQNMRQQSSGRSMYRFNRPSIGQAQGMRQSNIEAGPARIFDPVHPQEQYHNDRSTPMASPPVRRRQFPHNERAFARTQTYSFMNTGPPQMHQQQLFGGRGLPFNGGRPFPPQSPDFMMESGGRGMPSLRHSSFRSEQESNMFMRPGGGRFRASDEEEGDNDISAYRKTKVLKKKGKNYNNGTIIDGTKFRAQLTMKLNKNNGTSTGKGHTKKVKSVKKVEGKKKNVLIKKLKNLDPQDEEIATTNISKPRDENKYKSKPRIDLAVKSNNSTLTKHSGHHALHKLTR